MSDFVAGQCGRQIGQEGVYRVCCGDSGYVCPHCKRILELESALRCCIEEVGYHPGHPMIKRFRNVLEGKPVDG